MGVTCDCMYMCILIFNVPVYRRGTTLSKKKKKVKQICMFYYEGKTGKIFRRENANKAVANREWLNR